MGGGGGSSTSFLARSTTLQSFPLPLTPPPPSPSPHLNPLERSSLPTSVPLPTQTCFRIILELENAFLVGEWGSVVGSRDARPRAIPPRSEARERYNFLV